MSKPDLTYSPSGMFVQFMPETPAGEEAWRELARLSDNTGKFLPGQVPGVLAQLRRAGFTVRKAPPHKPITPAELEAALADLDALIA
jgi:hypothetical protein